MVIVMTTLTNRVTRRTRGEYSVMIRARRPIVVSLLPGDVLEFRELRTRKRFTLAIDDAYRIAIRATVEAARRAKREARGK